VLDVSDAKQHKHVYFSRSTKSRALCAVCIEPARVMNINSEAKLLGLRLIRK
jgi:hypothetical protein